MVSFIPWPLHSQAKRPQHPLDRRLGGPITGLDIVAKKKNPFIAPDGN
jgi:hypothetical protein